MRSGKLRIGLFVKFFASISLIIMVTSATISYFLISHEGEHLRDNLKQRGVELVKNLSWDSEYGVLIANFGLIKENLQRAMAEENVIYAVIYDKSGRILSREEGKAGIPVPETMKMTVEANAIAAKDTVAQFYRTDIFNEPIYDISFPIMTMPEERRREEISFLPETGANYERIGVARIGISLLAMNQDVADLTELAHIVTAAVILLGMLVAALLVGIIIIPIRGLVAGMDKVAKGDLKPVSISSNDETGDLALAFNQMVSQLLRYRKEAEGSRKSLQTKFEERTIEAHELKTYSENVIETMAEGLVTLDSDGVIKLVNRALCDLAGFSEDELVGARFIGKLFPEHDRERAIAYVAEVTKKGVLKESDASLTAKRGALIPVHFSGAQLKDIKGNAQGMVVILHDMRKEKEVEKMKNEFISTISHELRTPLTSIEGFTSLILGKKVGAISSKQEEFLMIVQAQSKHLRKLIQSLLDFSRMATGRMEIQKQLTAMPGVIEDVLVGMMSELQAKELKIEKRIEKGLPNTFADPEKIAMAISNIIGNAIKFSDKGGTLTIEVKKQGSGLLISLADNGIGLAKENLEKVFQRFFQVDSSLTRKIGGAGIGLAIAKEVVEAHGGRIWAESEGLGKGTTFLFTIPIQGENAI